MTNINKLNIENWDFKPHIEYFILNQNSPNTLGSLWYPETALQAEKKLKEIIMLEKKYRDVIPLDADILYKILFQAFSKNRSIENQLDIFLRKISSNIALTELETWFIVWQIGNRAYKVNSAYKPVNNEGYTPDKSTFLGAA